MSGDRRPRVVITGSRSLTDPGAVQTAINDAIAELDVWPKVVLNGASTGVDQIVEHWAEARNLPLIPCPAAWDELGYLAGIIRNWSMLAVAGAVAVVWDGRSPGSAHLVEAALELGIPTAIRVLDPGPAGAAAIRRVPPHAVARMLRRRAHP